MSEEPKSIWKKPLSLPKLFFLWLLLLAIVTFILAIIALVSRQLPFPFLGIVLAGMIGATFLLGLYLFFRWICNRRNFRRFIFGLVCLITLIALFYAVEDSRGKHAWDTFKRQCEANGVSLEWQSIVPPNVPDDQNLAMSPVWIAEIKSTFQGEPAKAESWYGDRIHSQAVSQFASLVPVSTSAAGTNDWWPAETPDLSGNWAVGLLTDLKPWQSYYRSLETTNPAANIPITARPQSPARDVALALSKYDPVMNQLEQDSRLPDSRFPVQYDADDKMSIMLPHLAMVKRYTQVLELRAIADLQNHDSQKAFAEVKLSLRLMNSIRTEPFMISQLVRLSAWQMALQPVWEGLAMRAWSADQLAALDSELGELDFLADYQLSMRTEGVGIATVIDYLQRKRQQTDDLVRFRRNDDPKINSVTDSPLVHFARIFPAGWFWQSQWRSSSFYLTQCLPLVDLAQRVVSPQACQTVDARIEAEISKQTPYNLIEGLLLWSFKSWLPDNFTFTRQFTYGQSSVDLARVAIGLERCRLAHGEFPESLDALAPQFMDQVPHDLIGGRPLHYRRTADGSFVLYSVGWNERDDGGVAVMKKDSISSVDFDQGDWVWRYPVK